ncbi:MAG TPA: hypothetical protein VGE85_06055 [Terracidiphilus sp.]|jgi:hypothetical protein
MKVNCGGNKEFKLTRRWFAPLSDRGFICVGILGCILVMLTIPVFAQNKNPCKEANDQKCGIIKGCKVAGHGVAVGTPFTFTHSDPYTSGTDTLLAGPAPGGYCKHGDPLPIGTNMVIKETPIPAGLSVSNITVTPASQLVSMNLSAGTVTVKIGPGVTEVTYTNHSLKSGYLEICKQGVAATAPMTGNFAFTIQGVMGTIVVPAGYCSPPIEVPAGPVIITETSMPGIQLASCTAFPASNGPCQVTGPWTVKVDVVAGDLSTQTIVTITNKVAGTKPK